VVRLCSRLSGDRIIGFRVRIRTQERDAAYARLFEGALVCRQSVGSGRETCSSRLGCRTLLRLACHTPICLRAGRKHHDLHLFAQRIWSSIDVSVRACFLTRGPARANRCARHSAGYRLYCPRHERTFRVRCRSILCTRRVSSEFRVIFSFACWAMWRSTGSWVRYPSSAMHST